MTAVIEYDLVVIGSGPGGQKAESGASNNVAPIAAFHEPTTFATAGMSLPRIDASLFGDPRCDLAAGGEPQFDQDVRDVGLGCSLGDDQRFSDGLIAQALRE